MSSPIRSNVRRATNLETDIETTPFAHKYLFKRPRIKEHASSYSGTLNLQHSHSSHTGFTIPGEENTSGEGIDNPMVEKRRFELFVDLIWVGIIGNIVSQLPYVAFLGRPCARPAIGLIECCIFRARFLVSDEVETSNHKLATGRTFLRPSLYGGGYILHSRSSRRVHHLVPDCMAVRFSRQYCSFLYTGIETSDVNPLPNPDPVVFARKTAHDELLNRKSCRMWLNLSNFMNKYHTNDLVERLFVVWQLALAMTYGNNAPYLIDDTAQNRTNIPIIVYLISKFSYTILESAYSIFLPFHRRGVLTRFLCALPALGLWFAALYTAYPTDAILLITAIFLEFLVYTVVDTPLFERLLREERAKTFRC